MKQALYRNPRPDTGFDGREQFHSCYYKADRMQQGHGYQIHDGCVVTLLFTRTGRTICKI